MIGCILKSQGTFTVGWVPRKDTIAILMRIATLDRVLSNPTWMHVRKKVDTYLSWPSTSTINLLQLYKYSHINSQGLSNKYSCVQYGEIRRLNSCLVEVSDEILLPNKSLQFFVFAWYTIIVETVKKHRPVPLQPYNIL